jgi:CDP-diacylglycerol--glycerol-3-phosphate 3-phosphatidyltransferase
MIFTNSNLKNIVIVFAIAAFTDFLDGQIARRFNLVTEFGRKADMIADRFLWVGTALAIVIAFGIDGRVGAIEGVQLLFIMTREIITAPFALPAFFSGKEIPNAKFIGKITTFAQGFSLPALIISLFYVQFIYISAPLSILTGILGIASAMQYMKDLQIIGERK